MTRSMLSPVSGQKRWGFALLLLFAIGTYLLGLDSAYIPTNGDEMVYAHIARLTAVSQHWLPLQSELSHMRNTKPPLLFWQAMVAGDWGQRWQLWALRVPSVIYTLLTTIALTWTVYQIADSPARAATPHHSHTLPPMGQACLAGCVYLAFFSTFRYGRPFLTSAAETFWFGLPMFVLLRHRLRGREAHLGWGTHVGLGLALGLGLAYKSFALVAPVCAAFWCALLLTAPHLTWRLVVQATLKTGLTGALALAVFGLWFVLDPDPVAVWQEFVVGENAGKLSDPQGYWKLALSLSGGSVWAQLLAYVQNAGLLAFVALGLMVAGGRAGWRRWVRTDAVAPLPPAVVILLVWLAVWLLVFTVPSQRSARYVIPAMPALAMLVALYWGRIARGWFVATALLSAVFVLGLARVAWTMAGMGLASMTEVGVSMLLAALGAGAVLLALAALVRRPAVTRSAALVGALSVFALFNAMVAPLSGPAGRYDAATVSRLKPGSRVAVPNGFNGQFERFQFVLPGHVFVPYDSDARAQGPLPGAQELQQLLVTHDAVVWLQAHLGEQRPPCASTLPATCQVLGTRWEVKGRHLPGEITLANLWYPQQWLFRREWLLRRMEAD